MTSKNKRSPDLIDELSRQWHRESPVSNRNSICTEQMFSKGKHNCRLLDVAANYLHNTKHQSPTNKKTWIVYPADNFGSLGDQAMVEVCLNRLRAKGYKKLTLLSEQFPPETDWRELPSGSYSLNACFWGGKSSLKLAANIIRNNSLYVVGADVMDGYYSVKHSLQRIYLLDFASRLGLKTRIFGFSFNESPHQEILDAFHSLQTSVDILARDPVSQRRLENTLNRPIKLVADLAFLLQPNINGKAASKTLSWAKNKRSFNHKIIGINANSLLAKGNFENPISVASGLAQAMVNLYLAHPNTSFVLIPHDFRGAFSDATMNNITCEMACFKEPKIRENIFIMPSPCHPSEVKAVSGELDYAITGRMHFAIACLGQGTPAICLSYQGKMEGLFEHFDLHRHNMTLPPLDALSSNLLTERAAELLHNSQHLRSIINKKLPNVLSLSESNFS